MKLSQLIKDLDIINLSADVTGDVSTLCYAADKCEEGSLFVAISGLKHDGHDYIADAASCGARYIVYEKDIQIPFGLKAIKVTSSRRALGVLAKNYFGNPSARLCLIGVTGTNGKTTTTYLLESILEQAGCKCGVLGTVNYRYNNKTYPAPNTTPESYEMQRILRAMADEGITHVIAEISSHAIDLKRIDDCDFDLGIFTNLSHEHLDYHLTMENYFQAKKRFFAEVLPQSKKVHPQKMIINGDDEWGRIILKDVKLSALTYGMEKEDAVKAVSYELSLAGIKADIDLAGEIISIQTPFVGKFNIYNILAAAAAAKALQIPSASIKTGIENISSVPGRLERINSSSGFTVLIDYAHKPDALKQVLQNLAEFKKKRIITVFGCGGNRDTGKRPLMGETATFYSDLTIITSDNPRLEDPLAIIAEIEEGIDRRKIQKIASGNLKTKDDAHSYKVIPERRRAIETAIGAARRGDIILIAGKGHEDYQILGTNKIPFDDRVVVEQILKLKESSRVN
ncbi:MAG: UDP-N-acetylmuramoyl-L-alanyl-D-glutamate--2,6-diaminopimelate ligase [Smithella sp.]|jgi:UDP-N-acetylmuramoyl-L-alanyl-D-glutamate--2,6-diaminopimelate ligase